MMAPQSARIEAPLLVDWLEVHEPQATADDQQDAYQDEQTPTATTAGIGPIWTSRPKLIGSASKEAAA
jgi:hypothetical protein